MNTRSLERLFLALIIVSLILLAALLIIKESEKEKTGFGGFKEVTGITYSFEVRDYATEQPFIVREYPKRYTEKIWEYYDQLSDARDRTFFR